MQNQKRRLRGGANLQQIQTANKNLETIKLLSMPKPPLQQPGQILHVPITQRGFGKRQRGGAAFVDKYGTYLRDF